MKGIRQFKNSSVNWDGILELLLLNIFIHCVCENNYACVLPFSIYSKLNKNRITIISTFCCVKSKFWFEIKNRKIKELNLSECVVIIIWEAGNDSKK